MTEDAFNPLSGAMLLSGGYRDAIASQLRTVGVEPKDSEALATELASQGKVYLSLNPRYESGTTDFNTWARDHGLHPALQDAKRFGIHSLYKHQEEAVLTVKQGRHTLITAGTGSGKTECFTIPILDWCLNHAPGEGGIQAIFIYPMNALAGDQTRRLGAALRGMTLKYGIYVGSTPQSEPKISAADLAERDPARLYTRSEMQHRPPDLLLTNHVQLDWLLTGDAGRKMLERSSSTLRFVVVDELHTFRGARAAHLKYLLRRLRDATGGTPVLIGASATLGDDRAAIEQFGSDVFDVPVHVIRADGEPNVLPRRPGPPVHPVAGDKGSDLVRHGWLHAISDILAARNGIASYGEMLDALRSQLPTSTSPIEPDELLLQCLQASISDEVEDRLDFRVHVFIPRLRDVARRCFQCKRLFSSSSETCPVCDAPAFPVAKTDPSAVLAVACRERLTPVKPYGPVPANGVPVLARIASATNVARGSVLRFRPVELTSDNVEISFDPSGPLELELVTEAILGENVLPLDYGTWSDSAEVFRQMLLSRPRGKRRLLGFQDDREKVSRTASEARDCFASAVFREVLRRNREHLNGSTLSEAIRYLDEIRCDLKKRAGSRLEAQLWDDFPFWLRRELTGNGSGTVRLEVAEAEADPAKRRVLEAFLVEGAIAGLPLVPQLTSIHHVWFFRHAAARPKAIHLDPTNGDPRVSTISLGPDARKHRQLVKDLGPDTVRKLIEELQACGWLERMGPGGGDLLYLLRADYVRLTVALESAATGDSDVTDDWLRAAMHSSELKADQRRTTEQDFRGGDLDFVVATPTLEMGIDVGDLEQVVMIGAPPMPSNYAQRAGRAGRKRGARQALIACLCSPKSDHDVMAFEDPTMMIAGRITPPQFEQNSAVVAPRHLHAWLASGHSDGDSAVASRARVLFGDAMDVDRYRANEYAKARANARSRRPVEVDERKWFYESGFSPTTDSTATRSKCAMPTSGALCAITRSRRSSGPRGPNASPSGTRIRRS